jgi:hypothetical protein
MAGQVFKRYLSAAEILPNAIVEDLTPSANSSYTRVMTEYWIEYLLDDDLGAKQLSGQLRGLACLFDIH